MELNELTNVIERSMKTISSGVTRTLARTAAYELLTYFEEKANSKMTWIDVFDNVNLKKCVYNNLTIATIEKSDTKDGRYFYNYKTNFPPNQQETSSSGSKNTFEEAQVEIEKMWSNFLQKMF